MAALREERHSRIYLIKRLWSLGPDWTSLAYRTQIVVARRHLLVRDKISVPPGPILSYRASVYRNTDTELLAKNSASPDGTPATVGKKC